MNALRACLKKETRLLLRDWHALALLFIMPALFIAIMSLALQERLGREQGVLLQGQLHLHSDSPQVRRLVDELARVEHLRLVEADGALSTEDFLFSLSVTEHFASALAGTSAEPGLRLSFAPTLGQRERMLIRAAIQQGFATFSTTELAAELGYDRDYALDELLHRGFIATGAAGDDTPPLPSSVQQNVPAWLIFAMFFIAVPLSTTVIGERAHRTLIRTRTFGAPVSVIYLAKLIPYFAVNLLQLALMLALGAWVLPLLGAEALSLEVNLPALLLVGACTSVCALALASLIAALVSSIEQATIASAAVNILLAAVGGIMIPVFIMPPVMQQLAQLSPMHWALEAFLNILVRQGSLTDVARPCAQLLALAGAMALIAVTLLQRGKDNG